MKNLLIVLFCLIAVAGGCSNEKNYDIESEVKYEKSKASIEDIEKKNPEQFLRVSGNSKKNLLRQMVIKGNIYNNAKMVTYKDVAVKIRFYSKTGALLEEDTDVVYESINPGGTTGFKSKYFAPKGADSIAMSIAGAKY